MVRNRLPGDWFCPSGMGGKSKKLQDFFVDARGAEEQEGQGSAAGRRVTISLGHGAQAGRAVPAGPGYEGYLSSKGMTGISLQDEVVT